MGLAVSPSLIDPLGGEFRVQNRRGEGTVFTIVVAENECSCRERLMESEVTDIGR